MYPSNFSYGFETMAYQNECSGDCEPGVVTPLGDTFIKTFIITCTTSKGELMSPQQCNFGKYESTCSLEYNSCKVSLLIHLKLRIKALSF